MPTPTDPERKPQLLILRALGLGDLLTAVPALRAIRTAAPDHHIVLATQPRWEPLIRLADAVDAIHPASGLDLLTWTRPPPDVAVNLHGSGPQSHRLLSALSPGKLLAFGNAAARHEGPIWRTDEHEVRRWCRLVREGWSCPADPTNLRLRPPPQVPVASGSHVVVLHPGAAYPARQWPMPRFAAVATWARSHGFDVRITGSAQERNLAWAVATQAGFGDEVVLAGRTSVEDLAALVSDARLVISGDTGIAHLAFAYGTPSVTMYGPTSPALWGPPASHSHIALWSGVASNQPFADTVDAGLLSITSAAVVAAAEKLLAYGEAAVQAAASAGGGEF